MGAGKWRTEYGTPLRGAYVTIVADNDEPGRKHARMVADDLVENHECTVRIMETPLANCKDYSAHRQHGGTDEMLVVTWTSVATVIESYGLDSIDFIGTEFTAGREIIPGALAEANVAVFVGPEGHGKTTFLRQFAVCAATGIHPFTTEPMDPLRVLFIDAENPEFQQRPEWSRLLGLAARHGHTMERGQLQILSEWRNEPDLITPDGQAWLYERITAYRPELIVMGPVQNIVGRDTKDDEVVRKFKHAVNNARAICGSAVLIEHHAPHRQAGDKERQMRPYGSSLFMKWPDIGYGLKPTEDEEVYDLYPFRKPRVRSRAWPEQLRLGKPGTLEFPWVAVETDLSGSTNVVPIRG
jgi:replicative DNA helicase